MRVQEIVVDKEFKDQFQGLPLAIKRKSLKVEILFKENPFHPSLRLHKLQGKLEGLWSISVDKSYRIIFKVEKDGVILFISIGRHSIYK